MKTLKSFTRLILAIFVLSILSSCEKIGNSKNNESLNTAISYVGYEYVILTVRAEGFDYIYNDATFYTSTTPDIDVNTASSRYYELYREVFNPKVLNMNPDSVYFGFAQLNSIKSNKVEMRCKKANFPCQVSSYYIKGDLIANQAGLFGSYNYLRDSDSYLGGELGGDLKKINLKLAYGNWDPGVYTTYVDGEKFVHEPMSKNPEVTVVGFDGTVYTAKPGQILWLKDGGSNDWYLVFCDMVFADNQGNEVTLSSNLAVRIF